MLANPTDYEKWRDAGKTFGALNPSRSELVAKDVPDGVHVLDLGAGSMVLKSFLGPNCKYTPCDIYDRGDGCIVADLNKYEFPPGRYDWAILVGLLEYVIDIRWVLSRAVQAAPKVLFTFTPLEGQRDLILRRTWGWISHYTAAELKTFAEQAGLKDIAQGASGFLIGTGVERG